MATIRVKTENGWQEVTTIRGATGPSGVHVGEQAPAGDQRFWIDMSDPYQIVPEHWTRVDAEIELIEADSTPEVDVVQDAHGMHYVFRLPMSVQMIARGPYDPSTVYSMLNWVTHEGGSYSYIHLTPAAGVPLSDTTHWQKIAEKGISAYQHAVNGGYNGTINDFETEMASIETKMDLVDSTALKADAMASGSPKGQYATLVALQEAFPTGDTGAYLVEADSHLYFWDSVTSTWVDGGEYNVAHASKVTLTDSDGYYATDTVEAALQQIGKRTIGTVSIKEYGAIGDGVTDDTVAITNAIDAVDANGGGVVRIPFGTYKITAGIVKTLSHDMNIVCEAGAVIDATSLTTQTAITLQGVLSSGYAITAAVDALDKSITCPDAADLLTKGDVILISTRSAASPELWDASRIYYYKGEMCRVESVSGDDIYLTAPLYDSYTADVTFVHKVSSSKVNVTGLKVIGNSNTSSGLTIKYARDVSVRDCEFSGVRHHGVFLDYVIGGVVENCTMDDIYDTVEGTDNYGIIISGQDIVVSNNRISGGNHCIVVGGMEPGRNIIIQNNTVSNKPSSGSFTAINTHENSEHVFIIGNHCDGGISVLCRNFIIDSNYVRYNLAYGSGIYVALLKSGGYCTITRNRVFSETSDVYGIRVSHTYPNISSEDIEISNNFVQVITDAIAITHINYLMGTSVKRLFIRNNTVVSSRRAISVFENISVDEMYVSGGSYTATDLIFNTSASYKKYVSVTNVMAISAFNTTDGISFYNRSNTANFIVSGCWIKHLKASGFCLQVCTTGNVTLIGNHFDMVLKSRLIVYSSNRLLMKNNIITGSGSAYTHRSLTLSDDSSTTVTTAQRNVRSTVFGETLFDSSIAKPVWCKTVGTKEIDELTISAGATLSGNITVTLNGYNKAIAVVAGDTAEAVALKVNAVFLIADFSEWLPSVTGAKVAFTKYFAGANSAPAFVDTDGTGVAASFAVTVAGTNNVFMDATGATV